MSPFGCRRRSVAEDVPGWSCNAAHGIGTGVMAHGTNGLCHPPNSFQATPVRESTDIFAKTCSA